VFGYLAWRRRAGKWVASTGTVALAVFLSVSMEIAQVFVPSRTCSFWDVVLNAGGAILGLALALRFEDRLTAATVRRASNGGRPAPGPLLLLCCWIGYQIFPFFPDLSRTHLAEKLAVLASADSWSVLRAFVSFAEWLAAGRLVEAVSRPGETRAASLALLCLLPSRLLVIGRVPTTAELAGAALALVPWAWPRAAEHGRRPGSGIVALILALALVLDGLAPFRFQGVAGPFYWIPFQAFLESDWQAGFAVFLLKSFAYGAAIWLLQQSGWRLVSAGLLTSLYLAAIEGAQRYLPGRTPEITDPLLALLMTLVLSLVDERSDRGEKSH